MYIILKITDIIIKPKDTKEHCEIEFDAKWVCKNNKVVLFDSFTDAVLERIKRFEQLKPKAKYRTHFSIWEAKLTSDKKDVKLKEVKENMFLSDEYKKELAYLLSTKAKIVAVKNNKPNDRNTTNK